MLSGISIYRIDIECEVNTDYEYDYPTSNDIKLKFHKTQCDFSDIELHFTDIRKKLAVELSLEGYLVGF